MQSRRLLECRTRLTSVKHIICAARLRIWAMTFFAMRRFSRRRGDEAIAEYRLRAARVTSDQARRLFIRPARPGEPKGVVLTHNNLSSNEEVSAESFGMSSADTAVSFLPLSHVYERVIAYAYLFRGVHVAYVERMDDLPQALLEVHPTLSARSLACSKSLRNIMQKGHENTGVKKAAVRLGCERRSPFC